MTRRGRDVEAARDGAKARRARTLALAIGVWLGGCASGQGPGGGGAADGGRTCEDDADCRAGWTCRQGLCEEDAPDAGPSGPAPRIELSPDPLDFGAPLLDTEVTLDLAVRAVAGPIEVTRITIEEKDGLREYRSIPPEGPIDWTLAVGETRTVGVTLAPVDLEADVAELCVDSNDPERPVACVDLVSEIKGEALLCANVLDDGEDPAAECSPAGQVVLFAGVAAGESAAVVVAFYNGGTENQPIAVEEETDVFVTDTADDGSAPFALELSMDPAFEAPAEFPALMSPGDEAGEVEPDVIYARVTFAPLAPAPVPDEDLCIDYRIGDEFEEVCLPIEGPDVACPEGAVDLDGDPLNGCECLVAAEVCDGADNDCNGTTDDGFGLGLDCDGLDADLCADDVMTCAGCSTGADNVELCNGIDDDCNGTTDDGFGLGLDCDGPDADLCADDVMTCAGCSTGADNVELCNGLDDDCNAMIDEGCACTDVDDDDWCLGATSGACCPLGSGDCADGDPTRNPAAAEVCNSLDDDCDLLVDEGFALGLACDGPDADLCDDDVTTCAGCSTGADNVEVCNGLDDDCNMLIDDGLTCEGWTPTATTGAPAARAGHTAVWTGSEMIVWGGWSPDDGYLATGGRYDPAADAWSATATGAPTGRNAHTAVWTGSEMIVWGGWNSGVGDLATGGRYEPVSDEWLATDTDGAPDSRRGHAAVWSGSEMIVWGGDGAGAFFPGGRYDPSADAWTAMATTSLTNRPSVTAVWTGTEVIFWGGGSGGSAYNDGGRYNPATDAWTLTTTTGAPSVRMDHTAIWIASEMIVWGGYYGFGGAVATGGRYALTDSWTATALGDAPSARSKHTAVWTGTEMIVWGGEGSGGDLATGGRYDAADTWTATATTGAPAARSQHTAVWTGTEMIVWGGISAGSYLSTGGRYTP